MKKRTKLALGALVATAGIIALSSCTQSFCSYVDQGRMIYAFDPGVTRYLSGGTEEVTYTNEAGKTYTLTGFSYEYATWDDTKKGFVLPASEDDNITTLTYLNNVISSSRSNGYVTVGASSLEYYKRVDAEVLMRVMEAALKDNNLTDGSGNITLNLANKNVEKKTGDFYTFQRQLSYFSYLKYVENDGASFWKNYDEIDNEVRNAIGNEDVCPSSDFYKLYKSQMNVFNYKN